MKYLHINIPDNYVLKNLEGYIKDIFRKMDINKDNQVTAENFDQIVSREPNLLEVFDFLNKGLTNSLDQDQKTLKHKVLANQLTIIANQIDMLLLDLQGHNIILKKMKTGETSPSAKATKRKGNAKTKSDLSKFKGKTSTNENLVNENIQTETKINSKRADLDGFAPTLSDYKYPLLFNQEEENFILNDEFSEKDSLKKRRKSRPAATMMVDHHQPNDFLSFTEKKLKRSVTPQHNQFKEEKKSEFPEISEKGENSDEEDIDYKKDKENSVAIEDFQTRTIKIISSLKELKESVKTAQSCLADLFDENDQTKKENCEEEQRNIIEEFR